MYDYINQRIYIVFVFINCPVVKMCIIEIGRAHV